MTNASCNLHCTAKSSSPNPAHHYHCYYCIGVTLIDMPRHPKYLWVSDLYMTCTRGNMTRTVKLLLYTWLPDGSMMHQWGPQQCPSVSFLKTPLSRGQVGGLSVSQRSASVSDQIQPLNSLQGSEPTEEVCDWKVLCRYNGSKVGRFEAGDACEREFDRDRLLGFFFPVSQIFKAF